MFMSKLERGLNEMDVKTLSLKEKMLIAAVEGTNGDWDKTFTMEDLAVWAWERDKSAWGLRGYEEEHPDLDKVRKDMALRGADSKGMVQMAWVNESNRVFTGSLRRVSPQYASSRQLKPRSPREGRARARSRG